MYGGPAMFLSALIQIGKMDWAQLYATLFVEGRRRMDFEFRPSLLHLFLRLCGQLRCGKSVCGWPSLVTGSEVCAEFALRSCDWSRGYRLILLELNSISPPCLSSV